NYNAFPALVFSYDRKRCESVGFEVTSQLAAAEEKFKDTDTTFRRKKEEFVQRKNIQAKAKSVKRVVEKGVSKMDRNRDDAEAAADDIVDFDPEAILPDFTFADFRKYGKYELEKDIENLKRWKIRDADQLCAALERGIGIHHAGMNRYRLS